MHPNLSAFVRRGQVWRQANPVRSNVRHFETLIHYFGRAKGLQESSLAQMRFGTLEVVSGAFYRLGVSRSDDLEPRFNLDGLVQVPWVYVAQSSRLASCGQ